MEDKQTNREIANKELKNNNLYFLSNTIDYSNNQELIIPEKLEELSSESGSVNNFNININSTSDGNTIINPANTRSIINNVLNSTDKNNPQEVKKNYINNLPDIPEKNNLFRIPEEYRSQNIKLNGLTRQEETFEDYSSYLSPAPSLDGFDTQNISFDLPSMANYYYSDAMIKNQNTTVKNRLEYIKTIIQKALGEVATEGSSKTIQKNLYVQQTADNRSFYNEMNNIFESPGPNQSNLEQIDQATREHHRAMEIRQFEAQTTIANLNREKERKDSENIELSEEMKATEIIDKGDYSPTVTPELPDTSYTHINNVDSFEYLFFNERNSPPIWRTALG